MKFRKRSAWVLVGGLLLLTACAPSDASTKAAPEPAQAVDDNAVAEKGDQNITQIDTAVSWATTVYEDEYISYEIPESWVMSPENSNEKTRLTFFIPKETTTDRPSNVNIAITLNNSTKDLDYGDPSIQADFHDFLNSLVGEDLPEEAADGVFTVYQSDVGYVYALAFDRPVDETITAHQTFYGIMGLDYGITIWATDWKDGCSPSVDEIAQHICSTIQIK